MYSIVTVAYSTVLHISKLLRVNVRSPHHTQKNMFFLLYTIFSNRL